MAWLYVPELGGSSWAFGSSTRPAELSAGSRMIGRKRPSSESGCGTSASGTLRSGMTSRPSTGEEGSDV